MGRVRTTCVAALCAALAGLLVACSSPEPPATTWGALGLRDEDVLVRDAMLPYTAVANEYGESPPDDAVVDPSAFAEIAALQALYDLTSIRRAIIDAALEQEEGTRASLGGQGLNEEAIDRIMDAMAEGPDAISAEDFLQIPHVVDYVIELENRLYPLED